MPRLYGTSQMGFLHIEGKSFPTIKIPTRFTAVIWNQTRDIRKICLYLWRGLSIRSQSARRFYKATHTKQHREVWLWLCIGQAEMRTHHSTDASAAGGGFKLSMQFFHCARGVKAFCQQNDAIQEEKGRNSIDDILHQLDPMERKKRA